MAGFRAGMSSSSVIGRKLGTVYGVEPHVPDEMDVCLRQLRSKLSRAG
jgi:hypothetical protein